MKVQIVSLRLKSFKDDDPNRKRASLEVCKDNVYILKLTVC